MDYFTTKVCLNKLLNELDSILLMEDVILKDIELRKIKLEIDTLKYNIMNTVSLSNPELPNLDKDK